MLCAWDVPPTVSFRPNVTCTTSSCMAERELIRTCPLILSHRSRIAATATASEREAAGRQRRLVGSLKGQTIAVVGDSMARQAFITLVARLRGLDWVIDPNTHFGIVYQLFLAADAAAVDGSSLAVDALELPHRPLGAMGRAASTVGSGTPFVTNCTEGSPSCRRDGSEVTAWALERARAESTAVVNFTWAPCSHDMAAAARAVQVRQ